MNIEYIDIRECLLTIFPEMKKERKDILLPFCKGVGLATYRYNDSDYSCSGWILSTKVLREHGVRTETFWKMNDKYPMFSCINNHYSYKWKLARVYCPTDNYFKVMMCAYRSNALKLVSTGKKKEEKEHVPDYQHTCRIDTDGLELMLLDCKEDAVKKFQIINLLCHAPDGEMVMKYNRKPCGRLFAMCSASIQNMSSKVRDTALKGYYRYDSSNCHYTIAAHYSNHPAIIEYAKNPDDVRESIGDSVGATKSEVKLALLQILYGASTDSLKDDSPLVITLGKERTERFLEDEQVKYLIEGVKDVTKKIIKKRGKIPNKTMPKMLAHYLMEDEAKMLDIALSMCPDVQGCFFDGFVSGEKMNKTKMEVEIMREMGYYLPFTEEII